MSNVWNIFQEKLGNNKTLAKNTNMFLVSSQRYQYFRHILQNQKVPESVIGLNNYN